MTSILDGKHPKVVMDFACGLGRSSIFFKQMFNWDTTKFIFVDGHKNIYGTKENLNEYQTAFHHKVNSIFNQSKSFYTNFNLLDRFLLSNGINRYDVIDINQNKNLPDLIKNVDFFYSFNAVGYHYDILSTFNYYKLHNILSKGAILVFGIRNKRKPFAEELKIDEFIKCGYHLLERIEGGRNQDFLVFRKDVG